MLSRYAFAIAVAVITSTHASDVADLIQIKDYNFESINKSAGETQTKLWPIIFAPKAGYMAMKLTAAWFKGAGAAAGKAATAKGTAWHVAGKAAEAGASAAANYGYGVACGALVGSIIGIVFEAGEQSLEGREAYLRMMNDQPFLQVGRDYDPNSADIEERGQAYFKSKIWDATMGETMALLTASGAVDFGLEAGKTQIKEAIETPSAADTVQGAVTMMGGLTIDSLSGITSGMTGDELGELIEKRNVNLGYDVLVARLTANTLDCAYFNAFDHESCTREAYDILKDFTKDRGAEIICDATKKMCGW